MDKLTIPGSLKAWQYPQTGVAYLAVLFLVAAIGISMAVVTQDVDLRLKREKEQDWFFVGKQYQQAIASYYNQSPDGLKALPKSVEELLLDKRFIAPVRHLRKAYLDPLTNQPWVLVKTPGEQLVGVRSEKDQAILSTQLIAQLQAEQNEVEQNESELNETEPNGTQQSAQAGVMTQYKQVVYAFKPQQAAVAVNEAASQESLESEKSQ